MVLSATKRSQGTADYIFQEQASRTTARLGVIAASTLVVCAIFRLFAQSYALHGGADVFNTVFVSAMLTRTLWGWGWILQVAAAVLAAIGFRLARSDQSTGWFVAAFAGVILAFTPALSGHAASVDRFGLLPFIADGLHVLGAAGWLGSLFFLVAAGLPAALQTDTAPAVRQLVAAFSPTALAFAAVTVISGVFAAWLHVGHWSALWQSAYGRVLLVKLGMLTGLFLTGAYNWRIVQPALGSAPATRKLRVSAAVELTIAVVVLLVTAILVGTNPQ
jgi:putative copper export protein